MQAKLEKNTGSVPLWRQLSATAQCLALIRHGQSGTAVMAGVASDIRSAVHALLFHVLRELGRAQALRDALVQRKPTPDVDALLCCALALSCGEMEGAYTSFTLVNQAVEVAKNDKKMRAKASFINGCLRRFIREKDDLLNAVAGHAQAQWNHPLWWIDQLKKDFPHDWEAILAAGNRRPPLTLRVNTTQCSVGDYVAALDQQGVEYVRVGAFGVQLSTSVAVEELPGYVQGWFSVQDAVAQLAAPFLLDALVAVESPRVLDACAAPGGKTAHLLEYAAAVQHKKIQVTALEIDEKRVGRIHENLSRLHLAADVVVADACKPDTWGLQLENMQGWDGILLDAPCTASGIGRRHPDIRWLRRSSDVMQLAAEQRKLLHTLWPLLKPGGYLLYCTCSLFKAEGEQQVQGFLAQQPSACLLPSAGHLLPVAHHPSGVFVGGDIGDHDGFFYALFQKKNA